MSRLFVMFPGLDSRSSTQEDGIRIMRGFCCVRVTLLSSGGMRGKVKEETGDCIQSSRLLLGGL